MKLRGFFKRFQGVEDARLKHYLRLLERVCECTKQNGTMSINMNRGEDYWWLRARSDNGKVRMQLDEQLFEALRKIGLDKLVEEGEVFQVRHSGGWQIIRFPPR